VRIHEPEEAEPVACDLLGVANESVAPDAHPVAVWTSPLADADVTDTKAGLGGRFGCSRRSKDARPRLSRQGETRPQSGIAQSASRSPRQLIDRHGLEPTEIPPE